MAIMPSCPSCGAEVSSAKDSPCAACRVLDARPVAPPDFELAVRERPLAKAPPRKIVAEEEVKLELAVDPRSFASGAVAPAEQPSTSLAVGRPEAALTVVGDARAELTPSVGDVAFDARLLADFGDAPRHWILSPLYAWRVLRRQRELKRSLVVRREEARRAALEVEDALVAFAERMRGAAEKHTEYARTVEELRGTEDVLRSRDRVLATEQDAQTARLAAVDARLARFEAELAQAQAAERTIAGELASSQAALARGESKLKRAESELRLAQQREADGSRA